MRLLWDFFFKNGITKVIWDICSVLVHMNQNFLEILVLLELAALEFDSKLRIYSWHWLNRQWKQLEAATHPKCSLLGGLQILAPMVPILLGDAIQLLIWQILKLSLFKCLGKSNFFIHLSFLILIFFYFYFKLKKLMAKRGVFCTIDPCSLIHSEISSQLIP